jgi:acetyltransferase-like isoleucine patch superfamily enzyme
MTTPARRTLPWDWYSGSIPSNVVIDESAYVETSFSFHLYRSRATTGVRIGRGASLYLGTMFDVGPRGQVSIGSYTLIHGARIICDAAVTIGNHALISWNVVLMDSRRFPRSAVERRRLLERTACSPRRLVDGEVPGEPIQIGNNVWIGFDACVLPGTSIGEGSIVAARSVVFEDVEPYTMVAGNPARTIRRLNDEGVHHDDE